jgi:hypothetical protein
MKLVVNCLVVLTLIFSSCSIPQYELFMNRDGSGVLHVKHDFVEGMALMGQLMEVTLNDDQEFSGSAHESIPSIEMDTDDDEYGDDSYPDPTNDDVPAIEDLDFESELSYEANYEDEMNWDEEWEEEEYELNKLQKFCYDDARAFIY